MRYYIDTEFNENGYKQPIELISLAIIDQYGTSLHVQLSDGWSLDNSSEWVKTNVIPHLPKLKMTRAELRNAIDTWIGFKAFQNNERSEFWGYYADYDWVLFCQLLADRMVDLPAYMPHYCNDLVQECKARGVFLHELKNAVPQMGTAHDALDDATTLWARHEWLLKR